MKRTKSKVAAILSIVMNAIWVVFGGWTLFVMMAALNLAGSVEDPELSGLVGLVLTLTLVVMAGLVICCLVSLILSACALKPINGDKEAYAKGKGVIIAAIVFNFITVVFMLLSLIGQMEGTTNMGSIILAVVSFGILLAANILFIVDLAQEKKRIAALEGQTAQETQTTTDAQ